MNTITDLLNELFIPYAGEDHKKGRPGWVQIDCPICGGIGKFHLGINLSNGACSCWKCGKQNTARAIAMAGRRPVGEIRDRLNVTTYKAPPKKRTGKLVMPKGRAPLGRPHKDYLRRRGFDPEELVDLWGLEGTAQTAGPMRWRVFIPIHYRGEVVSWTSRAIQKNAAMRYLSAGIDQEAISHKKILYGGDYAERACIIHEGPVDVWATGPGAVCTCGTAYTEAQLAEMVKYPVRVVCFDSSPGAQRRAEVLANDLAAFPGTTENVMLETGDDAADADPDEIKELRDFYL